VADNVPTEVKIYFGKILFRIKAQHFEFRDF